MSTRMLENRSDRILTILINPFMSCSARLPVYILLVGAFFKNYAALVLFGIYLFGILAAIVMAKSVQTGTFPQAGSAVRDGIAPVSDANLENDRTAYVE